MGKIGSYTCKQILTHEKYKFLLHWAKARDQISFETMKLKMDNQWPLLLTWFNFNPSMDK